MAQYVINNLQEPINFEVREPITRTVQNAKNLLMCHMGEVPYDRFRGFDPDLYDLPINVMRNELLPELDRVMLYEPDVSVADASATMRSDGSIYIEVIIDVGIKEENEE